jgi:hypothetical protein
MQGVPGKGVRVAGAGTARGSDAAAGRLAALLSADERLGAALGGVDFELLSVRPDGRPAIRHLGGSIVWVLVPPIVRETPLPPGQVKAIVRALNAFATAGEVARRTIAPSSHRP